MPGALEQYDAAVSDITDRRGEVYGHPMDDFDRAARLKEVVSECTDPHTRHALEMICVKMARLIESPQHVDSFVDIAGYSRCAVMCIDRKQGDEG